ncbi:hypothetical protein R5W23_000275 [Gemmata sp. JC673]|uniref:YtxH domain-containing protein n=1 Tax=Gemmata algarum TaxID=2975278 RepID=A0ABU5ES56_9BACT|nr:hypothetical protein [Gemmata algarum]MDY3557975.1 hypothetical protein [Gemmata algarum]
MQKETIIWWLLSLALAGGGGFGVWKWTVERSRVRKDLEAELAEKGKEFKEHEAEEYAKPRPADWSGTVDQL